MQNTTMHTSSRADATATTLHRLLADTMERYARQIDSHARRLLLTVERVLGNTKLAPVLRSSMDGLDDELREHLKDAAAWMQAASANQTLDQRRLRSSLAGLQRAVDHASSLLGRSDILLATSGPGTHLTAA